VPPRNRWRVAAALADSASRLTRSSINYWTGFAVDVAGIAVFLVLGLRAGGQVPVAACLMFVLGCGAWTLWEYYVHRFLFHEEWSPFASGHLAHHVAPQRAIGLPFFVAFALASMLFAACRLVLPAPYPYFFVAGAYLGWFYYGILHHLEHATDLSFARYRRLRRHHFAHHSVMSTNFGVSTTVWDRVFGTHRERQSGARREAA
jgi:sterol desaturase/sphingolipid hydroxylase (fatty acid hydroxylase superfamily)